MKTFLSTTKTNSRRTSSNRRKLGVILVVAALAIIFVLTPVGRLVFVFAYGVPPIKAGADVISDSAKTFTAYLGSKVTLKEENDRLRSLLADLEIALEYQDLKDENLKRLAAVVTDTTRIPAGVLVRPNDIPYDTLFIDRGTRSGVREGALVYGAVDTVLGVVIKAYDTTALVELFTAPGVESRVYVYGPDVIAESEGQGGGALRISVPQGIDLKIGNEVVFPTLSPGIIGTIEDVESNPADPETYGYISLSQSLASLRFVTVATDVFRVPSRTEIEHTILQASSTLTGFFALPPDLFVPTTTATTTE